MKSEGNNIFSVFDELLQKHDKESLLGQKGVTLWMTGLSGSGKTTIAKVLEKMLHQQGFLCAVLDGDNIRTGINNNLGFSETDRTENIRRIAEVSKLFNQTGIITINCFVSPTIKIRQQAKEIIGAENFIEVYINTPLHLCEQRDVKGLYAKAREGKIKDFTGISSPFEAPKQPEIEIKTEDKTPQQNAEEIMNLLIPKISLKK